MLRTVIVELYAMNCNGHKGCVHLFLFWFGFDNLVKRRFVHNLVDHISQFQHLTDTKEYWH